MFGTKSVIRTGSHLLSLAGIWIVLYGCRSGTVSQVEIPSSACIQQAAANYQRVAIEVLNLDQVDELDEVALVQNGELHILASLGLSPDSCELILDETLTSLVMVDGKQTVKVHMIEAIELTGDDRPELYVSLDIEGGGRSSAASIYIIFSSIDGEWQQVLYLEGCLPFSSLQFQHIAGEEAKVVYYEHDRLCVTPFSSERVHNIFRWNGSSFILVDSGTVKEWSMSPPIWYAICAVSLIGLLLFIAVLAFSMIRRSGGGAESE